MKNQKRNHLKNRKLFDRVLAFILAFAMVFTSGSISSLSAYADPSGAPKDEISQEGGVAGQAEVTQISIEATSKKDVYSSGMNSKYLPLSDLFTVTGVAIDDLETDEYEVTLTKDIDAEVEYNPNTQKISISKIQSAGVITVYFKIKKTEIHSEDEAYATYTLEKGDVANKDAWVSFDDATSVTYGNNTPAIKVHVGDTIYEDDPTTEVKEVKYSYAKQGSKDFTETFPTEVGKYDVKAEVSTTALWNSFIVEGSFQVKPKEITLSIEPIRYIYKDDDLPEKSPLALDKDNVTLKGYTDLAYNENLSDLNLSYSVDVTSDSVVGQYAIKVTEDSPNYTVKVKKTEKDGYVEIVPCEVTFKWSKANSAYTFTYNKKEQGILADTTNNYWNEDFEDGLVSLEYLNNTAILPGTYTAKITGIAGDRADCYTIKDDSTLEKTWSIKFNTPEESGKVFTYVDGETAQEGLLKNGKQYYRGTVFITVSNENWRISDSLDIPSADWGTSIEVSKTGTYTYYVMDEEKNLFEETREICIDNKAPSGSITIKGVTFPSFTEDEDPTSQSKIFIKKDTEFKVELGDDVAFVQVIDILSTMDKGEWVFDTIYFSKDAINNNQNIDLPTEPKTLKVRPVQVDDLRYYPTYGKDTTEIIVGMPMGEEVTSTLILRLVDYAGNYTYLWPMELIAYNDMELIKNHDSNNDNIYDSVKYEYTKFLHYNEDDTEQDLENIEIGFYNYSENDFKGVSIAEVVNGTVGTYKPLSLGTQWAYYNDENYYYNNKSNIALYAGYLETLPAGKYKIKVEQLPVGELFVEKFNDNAVANDAPKVFEIDLVVKKANGRIDVIKTNGDTESTTFEKEYDGKPYSDFTCLIPEGGKVTRYYAKYDSTKAISAYTWTEGMPTDAGDYIAKFVLEEGENFTSAVVTKRFEILPREITATVTVKDKTYNGKTLATVKEIKADTGVDGKTLPFLNDAVIVNFNDANVGNSKTLTATANASSQKLDTTVQTCDLYANYDIDYKVTKASIVQRPVTVKMKTVKNMIYGDGNALANSLTYNSNDITITVEKAEGELASDVPTSTYVKEQLGTIQYSTIATRESSVGEYAITGESKSTYASNYKLTVVGTLKINQKPIALQWKFETDGPKIENGKEFYYNGQYYRAIAEITEACKVLPSDSFNFVYETNNDDKNDKKDIGTYTTKVVGLGNDNYTLTNATNVSTTWKIKAFPPKALYNVKVTVSEPKDKNYPYRGSESNVNGWYRSEVVKLTPPAGYLISKDGIIWDTTLSIANQEEKINTITYYLKEIATGYISIEYNDIKLAVDKTAPEGEITVTDTENGSARKTFEGNLLSTIYKIFYKANAYVKVANVKDNLEKDVTMEYLALDKANVTALRNGTKKYDDFTWSKVNSTKTIPINVNQKLFLYVRLTDDAGNKTILSTDGIVTYSETIVENTTELVYTKYSGRTTYTHGFGGTYDYNKPDNINTIDEVKIVKGAQEVLTLEKGVDYTESKTVTKNESQLDKSNYSYKLSLNSTKLDTLVPGDYEIHITMNPLGEEFVAGDGNYEHSVIKMSLRIEKANTTITLKNSTKVYDGTPVTNPTYTTNSDSIQSTVTYYEYAYPTNGQYNVNTLTKIDAPKDAGTYLVQLKLAETDTYKAGTSNVAIVTIEKKPAQVFIKTEDKVYDNTDKGTFAGLSTTELVKDEVFVVDFEKSTVQVNFSSKEVGTNKIITVSNAENGINFKTVTKDDASAQEELDSLYPGQGKVVANPANYDITYSTYPANITKRPVYLKVGVLWDTYGDDIIGSAYYNYTSFLTDITSKIPNLTEKEKKDSGFIPYTDNYGNKINSVLYEFDVEYTGTKLLTPTTGTDYHKVPQQELAIYSQNYEPIYMIDENTKIPEDYEFDVGIYKRTLYVNWYATIDGKVVDDYLATGSGHSLSGSVIYRAKPYDIKWGLSNIYSTDKVETAVTADSQLSKTETNTDTNPYYHVEMLPLNDGSLSGDNQNSYYEFWDGNMYDPTDKFLDWRILYLDEYMDIYLAKKNSQTGELEIKDQGYTELKYNGSPFGSLGTENKENDVWYDKDVELTSAQNADYKISDQNTNPDSDEWKKSLTVSGDGKHEQPYAIMDGSGNITSLKTAYVNIDTQDPTGNIKIQKENTTNPIIKTFENAIDALTFGIFSKKTVKVTITAEDTLSGIDAVYYQKLDSVNDTWSDSNWTRCGSYNEDGSYDPQNPAVIEVTTKNKTFIVAKIVDKAGNYIIINTDGIVVYEDSKNAPDKVTTGETTTAITGEVLILRKDAKKIAAKILTNGNAISTVTCNKIPLNKDQYTAVVSGDYTTITLKTDYIATLGANDYEVVVTYKPLGEEYVEAGYNDAPGKTTFRFTVKRLPGEVILDAEYDENNKVYKNTYTYTGEYVDVPVVKKSLSSKAPVYEYKVQGADDSTYTSERPIDAGKYTVRVTVPYDDDYDTAYAVMDFTIEPKEVEIVLPFEDKDYDGNNLAEVDWKNWNSTGFAKPHEDIVKVIFTNENLLGEFADCNVGENITVEMGNPPSSAVSIRYNDGIKPANYTLKYVGTADITPRNVYIQVTEDAITYGTPIPTTFDFKVSTGLISGETKEDALKGLALTTVEETVKNAGEYQMKVAGETDVYGNYRVARVSGTFIINPLEADIVWSNVQTLDYNAKEQIFEEASIDNLVSGDDVTIVYDGNKGTEVDEYTATIEELAGTDKDNYVLPEETAEELSREWKIVYNAADEDALDDITVVPANWTTGTVTITPPTGYLIAESNISDSTGWLTKLTCDTQSETPAGTPVTYALKNITTGAITSVKTIKVYIDKTAPTGTITIKENPFTSLLNKITFGLFFNKTEKATITPVDNESGIKEVYYHVATGVDNDFDPQTYVNEDTQWTKGTAVDLKPAQKAVVFAKIVNNAGIETVICSDGVVVYNNIIATTEEITFERKSGNRAVWVSLNGNTVDTIKDEDGRTLLAGKDYEVDNTTGKITFYEAYLNTLSLMETTTLVVNYNPLGEEYKDATGNVAPATTTIEITAAKNQSTYITIDADADLVYDGNAKVFEVETNNTDQVDNVTFKYRKAGETNYVVGTPKDAGTYEVVATIPEDDNYIGASSSVTTVTIAKRQIELNWTNNGKVTDGKLIYTESKQTVVPVITNLVAGDTCNLTTTGTSGIMCKTYTAKITGLVDENGNSHPNYTVKDADKTFDWSISYKEDDRTLRATLQGTKGENGWYISDVSVIAPDGYRIAQKPTESTYVDSWGTKLTISNEGRNTVTYLLQNRETNEITLINDTLAIYIDKELPTATIEFKEKTVASLLNKITFGLFFKNSVEVTITSNDSASDIATTEYQVVYDDAVYNEDGTWTEYKGKFAIDAEKKAVVYVKLTDYAGHKTIINSDEVVVYKDVNTTEAEMSFTKATTDDVTVAVEMNKNTVKEIKNGDDVLVVNRDYTVGTDKITFHASYLDTLTAGDYELEVVYNPYGLEAPENITAKTAIDLTVLLNPNGKVELSDDSIKEVTYGTPIQLKVESSSTKPAKIEYMVNGSWTETVPTDAGTYDVKITVPADENYAEKSVELEDVVTINKLPVTVEWTGDVLPYTATAQSVTATVKNLVSGDTCKLTVENGTQIEVGTYTAKVTGVTGKDSANYTITGVNEKDLTHDWSIACDETVNAQNVVVEDVWYTDDVAIKAPEGYEISTQNTSANKDEWTDELTASDEGANEFVYYLRDKVSGAISEQKKVTVKIDTVAPTGTITIKENAFTSLLNTITFGLFFKDSTDVTITAEDDASKIAKIEYQVVYDDEAYNANGTWTTYAQKFAIKAETKAVVYAKLTDNAGHVTIINSDGFVVYKDVDTTSAKMSFTKATTEDVTVAVVMNNNTVKEIKNGNTTLKAGTDYTVGKNAITFHASYLDTLTADDYVLKVTYNPYGLEAPEELAAITTEIALTVSLNPNGTVKLSDASKKTVTYGTEVQLEVVSDSTTKAKIEYLVNGSWTETAPKNAGSYAVQITAPADENYTAQTITDIVTINQRPITVVWSAEKLPYTATAQSVTASVDNLVSGDTCELTVENATKTAVGAYTAAVTGVKNANYTITDATGLTHNWSIACDGTVNDQNAIVDDKWYNDDVVAIKAPTGYEISTQNASADEDKWTDELTASNEGENKVVYYLRDEKTGAISEKKEVTVKIDRVAPTGTITIKDNGFKEFINNITFGLLFKNTVDVTITGADTLSGVAKIEYQKVANEADYKENGTWIEKSEFSISENSKAIIYARITDNAGNVTIINTEGLVVYTDVKEASANMTFTKTTKDDQTVKVTLNGNTVKEIKNGETTLTAGTDYTVDTNGNIAFKAAYLDTLKEGSYTLTVAYKPFGVDVVEGAANAPETTKITLTVKKAELTNDQKPVINVEKDPVYDGQKVEVAVDTTPLPNKATQTVTVLYKEKDAKDDTYTTTAPKNAGDYVVKVTVAADDDYKATEVTKEFTISPKPVTVKVTAAGKVYGDALTTITGTAEGLVEGETYADLGLTLKAVDGTNDVTAVTAVGTYSVTGTATNKNYAVTVSGEFTVSPRPVQLTWPADNKLVYNDDVTAQKVEATVANAIAGDTFKLEYQNNEKKAVGNYTAKVTELGNDNYTLDGATGIEFAWSIEMPYVESDGKLVIGAENEPTNGWYDGAVTITPPEGSKIRINGTDKWLDSVTISDDGTHTVAFEIKDAKGNVSKTDEKVFKIDATVPEATVSVNGNNYTDDTTDDVIFVKDTLEVTLSGDDATSKGVTVSYQKVPAGTAYDPNGTWTEKDSLTIEASEKVTIWAKVTDAAGNETFVKTADLVVYKDATAKTEEISYIKTSTIPAKAEVELNGNTVNEVKIDDKTLVLGSDYAVDNTTGVITFSNDVLDALQEGNHTVTISYNPLGEVFDNTVEGNVAPAITTIPLKIQKADSNVTGNMFTSDDFAKEYDGTSVVNPESNVNGQTVTYEYKAKGAEDSTYTTTPPTNAGDYTVRITAVENDYCNGNVVYIDFTIAKKAVSISADALSALSNTEVAVDVEKLTVTGLSAGHSVQSIKAEADTSKITEEGTYKLCDAVIVDAKGNDVSVNYEFTYGTGNLTVTHNSQLQPTAISVEAVKGYKVGDVFSNSDIKVIAIFEDGHEKEVTGFVTNAAQIDMTKVGMKQLQVSYTENGKTVSETIYIDVTEDQGKVGFEVIQQPDAPMTTVRNDKDVLKDKILTEEEKDKVVKGEDYNIYLEVKNIGDSVDPEDKKVAEDAMNATENKDKELGMYIDISLFKKIGEKPAVYVEQTDVPLEICIVIPDELLPTNPDVVRTYQILRVHNGEPTIIDGKFNAEDNSFVFETNQFSTYAIIYSDKVIDDTPTDKPADTPTDKPADTPTDKPADTPADKPADTPADKPADTPADKPADTPADKPADTPADKPADTPTDTPEDSTTGTDVPKTGDEANLALWSMTLLFAIFAFAKLQSKKKRQ